jgi:hypothetical protein
MNFSPKSAGVPDTPAMTAADLSLEYRLALADSIVVTSDADFERLPRVTFLKKQ